MDKNNSKIKLRTDYLKRFDINREIDLINSPKLNKCLPRKDINNAITNFLSKTDIPWAHSRLDLFTKAINYLKDTNLIDGLYLDFGTLTGTCANAIADLIPDRTVYGFDSWKGYPDTHGIFQKGEWALPIPNNKDDIIDRKSEYTVRDNVKLIIGYFEDTLIDFLKKQNKNIALLHIDCDLYSSTKFVLSECINYIKSGTIIQFNGFFQRWLITEYMNYGPRADRVNREIVYWLTDEFNAWNDFVKEFNVEFEYFGSQGFSCSMLIKKVGIEK